MKNIYLVNPFPLPREAQGHAHTHWASQWWGQDRKLSPDSQPSAPSSLWTAALSASSLSVFMPSLCLWLSCPNWEHFHRHLSSDSEVNSCSRLCCKQPGSWCTEIDGLLEIICILHQLPHFTDEEIYVPELYKLENTLETYIVMSVRQLGIERSSWVSVRCMDSCRWLAKL